jgi:LacI family transcriptional regulator
MTIAHGLEVVQCSELSDCKPLLEAGAMATRKKVAVMVSGHALYGREVAQGIAQYTLNHADWDVHYEGVADHLAIQRIVAAISDWPADGVIVQTMDRQLSATVNAAEIPGVLVGGQFADGVAIVCPDNRAVGAAVAEYLIGRGLRSLAFCSVQGEAFSDHREEGFRKAARNAGVTPTKLELSTKSRDWISDCQAMNAWLQSLPRPTGLMACNDSIARDVVAACCRLGIHVPDDLAIVGVDNDSVECSMSQIPLSSVKLPTSEIGYRAAEVLDDMMSGKSRRPNPICLPPTMVVTRQSSDTYMVENLELREALCYIREHAAEPITVADILKAVPVSRRWLEKQFQAIFGYTIREEILRAHAEYAKRLLVDTDLKISAISRKSGYTQYQVFPHLFKHSTGMLPSEFRRRFGAAVNQPAGNSGK